MRYDIRRFLAFLLTGFALTVGASWSVMVLVGLGDQDPSLEHAVFSDGLRADYDSGAQLGVRWCFVVWSRTTPPKVAADAATLSVDDVPNWSGLASPPYHILAGGAEVVETTVAATGFPWPCLAVRVQQTFQSRTMPKPEATLWDGVPLPVEMSSDGFPPRRGAVRLPLVPLGLGFVANVACWGLAAWGVAAAAQAVRRLVRRHRGLCPNCGHRVLAAGPCTECGSS
jgi:hypothetical protein